MRPGILLEPTEISEEAKFRNLMILSYMTQLNTLAWRIQHYHQKKNTDMVVFCIHISPFWGECLGEVLPDVNWSALGTVICGNVTWGFCSVIAERMPNIKEVVLETPDVGHIKLFALSHNGATVYEIPPVADTPLKN